jgi:Ca2+-binding EF-hand superfamily protein
MNGRSSNAMRLHIVFVALAAAGAFSGCQPAKPKVAPPVPAKPASVPAAAESPALPNKPSSAAADITPSPEKKAAASKDEVKSPLHSDDSDKASDKRTKSSDNNAGKKDDASAPPQANHPERIAILTAGGPLIVDVTLTIDGHPAGEAFEKLVDGVIAAAHTDKDTPSTWKELAANEEYLKTQNYDKRVRERDLKTWTDQYDLNHDGEIQRDEAAAWLGRAAGRRMRAFNLRSSRSYGNVASASSRIWKLLDVDGDGQLSAAELGQCAKTLLAFDDDDDGVVTAEEFATLRDLLMGGDQATMARSVSRAAALHLQPDFAADRLNYLLTDLYAPQQDLQPGLFPALTAVYQKLDANGDGLLDQDEIATLLTIAPHLQLTVEFMTGNEKSPGKSSLKVGDHIPELSIADTTSTDRAVVMLGTTRLVIMAEDLTTALLPAQAAAATEIRLMVHDNCDSLCELLDADADGRLGEREISSGPRTLLQFDVNHDGVLEPNELTYTMIIAFMRGERPEEESFYRPRSTTARSAPAETPEWFIRADFNGDGDVSRREFLGTAEQFSRLDTNGDGFISAAEAASAK